MSENSENKSEKITPKSTLRNLVAASKVASKRSAEERGAYGAKVKAAEEGENLDAKAFRIVNQLAKLDPKALTVRWRNVQAYADSLGFNDQGDLLDRIKDEPDTRTPIERELDGKRMSDAELRDEQARQQAATMERESEVEKLLDGNGVAGDRPEADVSAIARFRTAISNAVDTNAVNMGLDRFCGDYPHLTDDAMSIAEERLKVLAKGRPRPSDGAPALH